MTPIKCKSGLVGWRCRLRENYADFAEWIAYSETYGLSARLGYKSAAAAWKANPIVEGSTNPSDYKKTTKKGKK
jgi:hypothetical protein